MPSIGGTELVIILVFAFLLFGPDKLPQMGRTIGRALRQFRETQEKLTNVVQTEVVDPMAAAANAPKKGVAAADDEDADIAVDDEDADIAEGEAATAAPRRKETFAERRARLAAEKAQKEAAEAADAESEQQPVEAAPEASAEQAASEPAVTSEPAASEAPAEPQDDEPAEITTEDLYARRPRKHRAAKTDEASAAADAEGGEQ